MFFRFSSLCSGVSVLALFLLVSCTLSGNALGLDDWPHWRGPDRNDKSSETGLLKQWPEEGPKQIWANKKAGLGYSGFAISGDQLFTMGLEDEHEFALCLNAQTGEEVWRQNIGDRYSNNWGDGPRSTPTIDGDHLFMMAAGGDLVCLNKADGAQVWSVNSRWRAMHDGRIEKGNRRKDLGVGARYQKTRRRNKLRAIERSLLIGDASRFE